MKVTVEIEVESLPEDRLLAFITPIGSAELSGRTFEVCRSISGLHFSFHEEQSDGITIVHTLNLNPVIQAALEAVVEGDPVGQRGEPADVVPGSEEDLIRKEKGL